MFKKIIATAMSTVLLAGACAVPAFAAAPNVSGSEVATVSTATASRTPTGRVIQDGGEIYAGRIASEVAKAILHKFGISLSYVDAIVGYLGKRTDEQLNSGVYTEGTLTEYLVDNGGLPVYEYDGTIYVYSNSSKTQLLGSTPVHRESTSPVRR